MTKFFAALVTIGALVAPAPYAVAAPEPVVPPVEGEPEPTPDTGAVASGEPSVVTTPDGWVLKLAARDETQLPIPALTTATSSREYLAGGTFTGSISGNGSTSLRGGSLEAGYQIGCGIALSAVRLTGSLGLSSSLSRSGLGGVSAPIQGNVEVRPKPGEVINVPVTKMKFKGKDSRVTLKDVHIKIDGCVGQSFLRSYAQLTSAAPGSEDIVAYYGLTKTV
ncbi:MspA protein [Mycolicibacterium sp. (ex Dasyatis americana)]|uniref:MspA protein n=1 Tax=Mycobacterium syngnathidarum TaxID=1908205 RepID=A0A1S1KA99_9MYCO|nr:MULTISPECIES: MspA family porin [Mycobacterium]MCG7607874.1 MspA family porin [Mycobacterium sp. CnD-18-1]OFB36648.1 MspA protein [Mycolicibacterium sp. (ex Dasyatis americana)]OHU00804.1 MspA protein [Mycobacterium syngnathidarum]OLT97264.1 MspA protein [Mycobacterium syngnathidarum]